MSSRRVQISRVDKSQRLLATFSAKISTAPSSVFNEARQGLCKPPSQSNKILKSALKKPKMDPLVDEIDEFKDSIDQWSEEEETMESVTWTLFPIWKPCLWEPKTMTVGELGSIVVSHVIPTHLRCSLKMRVTCFHDAFDLEWVGWDVKSNWSRSVDQGETESTSSDEGAQSSEQPTLIIRGTPLWSTSHSTTFAAGSLEPFEIEFFVMSRQYHSTHGWIVTGEPSLSTFKNLRERPDFIRGECTLNLALVEQIDVI